MDFIINICYSTTMILEYMTKQLRKARFKKLEDGSYFAEIPGVRGVWASGPSLRVCRKELGEVLEGWLLLTKRRPQ